jgi:hypothetical protein
MHDQMVDQEIKGVFETTSIVSGEAEVDSLESLLLAIDHLSLRFFEVSFNDMLILQLVENVSFELRRAYVFA